MRLPNAQAVSPELVRRIVEYVGAERLATSLTVSDAELQRWLKHGIPDGPVAACLRYLAAELAVPTNSVGSCVLCGADAAERVANTPVCTSCSQPTAEKVRALGMGYWDEYVQSESVRYLRFAAISARRAFERPLHVQFSPQPLLSFRKDPEVGDETFDKNVWIETDEYEAVFDTFQLARRRQLVYDLTRHGDVRIDVNDVAWDARPLMPHASPSGIPVRVVLLGWSLLYETSNAWGFE